MEVRSQIELWGEVEDSEEAVYFLRIELMMT